MTLKTEVTHEKHIPQNSHWWQALRLLWHSHLAAHQMTLSAMIMVMSAVLVVAARLRLVAAFPRLAAVVAARQT